MVINFEEARKEYEESLSDVDRWIKEEYDSNFAEYFKDVEMYYNKLASTSKPITDKQLEQMMSNIPLQLFSAAEALNVFKAKVEVLKIDIKTKKKEILATSGSSTKQGKEDEAEVVTASGQMLVKVYETIIERVERQMSYSRELIMSAKKIWTARKEEESSAKMIEPVSPAKHVNPPLPEYGSPIPDTYIK